MKKNISLFLVGLTLIGYCGFGVSHATILSSTILVFGIILIVYSLRFKIKRLAKIELLNPD